MQLQRVLLIPISFYVCMLIRVSIIYTLLCHVLDLSLNKEFCIVLYCVVILVISHFGFDGLDLGSDCFSSSSWSLHNFYSVYTPLCQRAFAIYAQKLMRHFSYCKHG